MRCPRSTLAVRTACCHKEASKAYLIHKSSFQRWHHSEGGRHSIPVRHKDEIPSCHTSSMQILQEAPYEAIASVGDVLWPHRMDAQLPTRDLNTIMIAVCFDLLIWPADLHGLLVSHDGRAVDFSQLVVNEKTDLRTDAETKLNCSLDAAHVWRRNHNVEVANGFDQIHELSSRDGYRLFSASSQSRIKRVLRPGLRPKAPCQIFCIFPLCMPQNSANGLAILLRPGCAPHCPRRN
mmetsp:Transcript_31388/g.56870  ORF Transcript_31388/g.56870 Transcript_31388/m.56870 type:complete len:236 (+) Transcript_31388:763-1470(+)